MLVEAPLRNLFGEEVSDHAEMSIDWLDLTWIDCSRRAMRKRTRADKEVNILLRLGLQLRHGDVLWQSEDGATIIAVNILPAEVFVAKPHTRQEAISLAFELGNLHNPIQVVQNEIITPADGPIEAVFDRLGIPFHIQTRRFEPTLRGLETFVPSKGFSLMRS